MGTPQAALMAHPWHWFATQAVMIYGLRYLLLAAVFFCFARPTANGGWGRPHAGAPTRFNLGQHVRRELAYSALTTLMFGAVYGALFGWAWIRGAQVYYRISDYGAWWFWLSIPVMLLLHDTFFYWLHRAMHTRLLFGLMHRVHHQSIHPTAFAAYSFHPSEALAEALIVTAVIYLIPTHPLAFLIFQTISTLYNVYGHCGREFYPRGMADHWLGRWINTSTAHASHHRTGRGNYGLYLLTWDRWMGTASTPLLEKNAPK